MSLCRHLLVLVALGSTLLASGCASFRQDRKAARAQATPPTPVEGLWTGEWKDASRPEHGGQVEAVLTRTGDQLYRFAARSQWWRVFSSAYDTTLVLTPAGAGDFLVRGDKSLWLFGDYTVTGRVDANRMELVYRVGDREGRMTLHRAAGGSGAAASANTAPGSDRSAGGPPENL